MTTSLIKKQCQHRPLLEQYKFFIFIKIRKELYILNYVIPYATWHNISKPVEKQIATNRKIPNNLNF